MSLVAAKCGWNFLFFLFYFISFICFFFCLRNAVVVAIIIFPLVLNEILRCKKAGSSLPTAGKVKIRRVLVSTTPHNSMIFSCIVGVGPQSMWTCKINRDDAIATRSEFFLGKILVNVADARGSMWSAQWRERKANRPKQTRNGRRMYWFFREILRIDFVGKFIGSGHIGV